uniref:queuosine precursor transporter n=1 Tax=Nocardia cyriacigeorgica TaxID=135487 RepID=UPI002455B2C5
MSRVSDSNKPADHEGSGRPAPDHAAFAQVARGYYTLIVALFTATLIISNVCATKGVQFFTDQSVSLGPIEVLPITTDGAFFLFPLAYILGDVLSEVYGFRATRRAIYYGFGALLLMVACFALAIQLPPAGFYENQEAFRTVLGTTPQLVAAGLAGYFVGQLLNSATLVLIKERTREKHLWARLIGSTPVHRNAWVSASAQVELSGSGAKGGKIYPGYVVGCQV